MHKDNVFTWEGEVRDHEIDFQGRVHNIYYLVYMEHARYKHCNSLGIDFRDPRVHNFDMVLARIEIDYKASLKGRDEFIVTSKPGMIGRVRFLFEQEVIRKSDQKIMAWAKNIIVCVDRVSGRPVVPDELKLILNLR